MTETDNGDDSSLEDVSKIFGKFMEVQVLERLMQQDNVAEIMSGQSRRVTCMFCDICGFTPLAEKTSAPRLFALINRYFGEIIDIAYAHNGTVDKLIGDAIMVLFGAPTIQHDQEERAVRCAIDIQQKLVEIRDANMAGDLLEMSVTINTGMVSAGCVGNERRMDYTVLGDAINVAARMQDRAKPNQILIGEETYRSLPSSFTCEPIGAEAFKGRSRLVNVYEVMFA